MTLGKTRTLKNAGCGTQEQLLFEVEGALILEEFQIAEDVGFDFGGVGFGVELLEFGDDFADGAFAIAALDDF